MPDPLRNENEIPGTQLENSATDPSVEPLLPGPIVDDTHLLAEAHNPRLNRTAESIGSALGTTVGRLRSGLTLVQKRQGEATHGITEKISEQAHELSAAAIERAEQLGDVAEETAGRIADTAQQQWTVVRANTRRIVFRAREQAAVMKEEKPLHLIGAFAALSFVVGFTLRVWRSSND